MCGLEHCGGDGGRGEHIEGDFDHDENRQPQHSGYTRMPEEERKGVPVPGVELVVQCSREGHSDEV